MAHIYTENMVYIYIYICIYVYIYILYLIFHRITISHRAPWYTIRCYCIPWCPTISNPISVISHPTISQYIPLFPVVLLAFQWFPMYSSRHGVGVAPVPPSRLHDADGSSTGRRAFEGAKPGMTDPKWLSLRLQCWGWHDQKVGRRGGNVGPSRIEIGALNGSAHTYSDECKGALWYWYCIL